MKESWMSSDDKYEEIAEIYDAMLPSNSMREEFFQNQFRRHGVKRVLDCACGTGNDLLLFHRLGYAVCGSDLSEAMLAVAKSKLLENNIEIPLRQVDFHHLEQHYSSKFDAVVCLSNAINELEVDVGKALQSMRRILNPGGIIVFDQGQTDFSMKNPPLYRPIVNNKDISRLFVMDYAQSVMIVQVFDFIHKEKDKKYDFYRSEFKIRIRLLADWQAILHDLEMQAEYYGDWDSVAYDVDGSKRLIIIAKEKKERESTSDGGQYDIS
jgi:ubiquinone/menaquinone biosynthesis C-methylase UbiE